jgi:tRNA 2-selenouridine synthase
MLFRTANLSQLGEFDAIIDVRTPAEFAEDHIPGAINCPVFSNEERITVGTLYKQVSPFAARKVGAAMVAKNIAQHLENAFHDHPKSWKPLIYCWRGGQRSGAMSIILSQVGWAAHKLEGGYKVYRRSVLDMLDTLPAAFDYRVICGATGSGKSRLLAALAESGAQVLDLEELAQHRGSVLGGMPNQPQPSQKWFENSLVQTLQKFDATQPVFVEAESNKIGRLVLPATLHNAMHSAACVLLDTAPDARLDLLLQDYQHFISAPEKLLMQLQVLQPFHGKKRLEHWATLIHAKQFRTLVAELLKLHYDPSYLRALGKHYPRLEQAQHLPLADVSDRALQAVAQTLRQSKHV